MTKNMVVNVPEDVESSFSVERNNPVCSDGVPRFCSTTFTDVVICDSWLLEIGSIVRPSNNSPDLVS